MKSFLIQQAQILSKQKFYLTLLGLCLLSFASYAKPSSQWRAFFNALHLNFATGYGISSYETMVYKYKAFFQDGQLYVYNPASGPQTAYLVQWYSKPYIKKNLYNPTQSLTCSQGELLSYSGIGQMLPLIFSVHTDIKKKLRFEIGSSICINSIKQLAPDEKNQGFGTYNDAVSTHYLTKIFASLGHKLLENNFCTLLVNTQFSYDFIYGDIFEDDFAVAANYWMPAIGIGFTFEKHISEYMSWFCRLTYEKLRFVDKPEPAFGGVINSNRDNFLLQIGLTVTCGEIPTCPIHNCKIEGKHNHGEKTYRGVAIPVGKNSKGYRIYKK